MKPTTIVKITTALATAVVAVVFCLRAAAQVVPSTSSGTVNTSWGYYIWQADYGGVTTSFMSETGFSKSAGTVQIPVTLPAAVTIGELHGDVSFTVWRASSCPNGSAVAQVRDQYGNILSTVNLTGRVPSTISLPISAKFGTPIHITALQLQTSTAQCGHLTVSWALVMS